MPCRLSTSERTPPVAAVGGSINQASIEKSPGGETEAAARLSEAEEGTSTRVVLPSKRRAPLTHPAPAVSEPAAVPLLSKAQMSSMNVAGDGMSSGHQATRLAGGRTQPATGVTLGVA